MGYELWCDGACSFATGGAGGWAAVLVDERSDSRLLLWGWGVLTTNNRMELQALIEGLKALGERPAALTVYTDSSYVKNAFTQGWLAQWDRSGWRNRRGQVVANQDLWSELRQLVGRHQVGWVHVRGHQRRWNLNSLADSVAVYAKHNRVAGRLLLPAGEQRLDLGTLSRAVDARCASLV